MLQPIIYVRYLAASPPVWQVTLFGGRVHMPYRVVKSPFLVRCRDLMASTCRIRMLRIVNVTDKLSLARIRFGLARAHTSTSHSGKVRCIHGCKCC
jgi:hypothetical protein